MTKIKRYEPETDGLYENMVEHPDGEWVRWEDVEELFSLLDQKDALIMDSLIRCREALESCREAEALLSVARMR
jgi:hypothetical protein